MRNSTTTTRRTPTPLIITALLALAAILAIMAAAPAAVPAAVQAAVPAQTTVDYDTDDDGYIEVNSLAKLNVIRHDLDGNGDPTSGGATAYGAAFPNRVSAAAGRMGCPNGACVGYELTANLTFDENGDGSITSADSTYWDSNKGWNPIGTTSGGYSGDFKGNRYTIDYLYIDRDAQSPPVNGIGLFARIEATSRVESLGLTNADVAGHSYTAALVGQLVGTVVGCYSTGSASIDAGGDGAVGGLVGWLAINASPLLASSYSTASVSGHSNAGGLVGSMQAGEVRHSYATGAVTRSGTGSATTIGGLVGSSSGTVTASYYDSTTTGCVTGSSTGCTTSAGGTAQTTANLQTPTGYTGIYAAWNVNLNDIIGNDFPWEFGTSSAYPSLVYGTHGDHDTNQNNLIEIKNHAQLDAVRHDLDGNGTPASGGATTYNAAFVNRATGMGCASTCAGYELAVSLSFDENGDGAITSADAAYWDSGSGWEPIGDDSDPYTATFRGNGNTIDVLFIARSSTADVGLFGAIGAAARIDTLGIRAANVTGGAQTGILAGRAAGEIVAVFTNGAATGTTSVGGIAGLVQGATTASVLSSYSTAAVSGTAQVGGLVGRLHSGTITDTYARGAVTRSSGSATTIGGLIGEAVTATGVSRSYYNSETTGCASGGSAGCTTSAGGSGVEAKTTSELQTPTTYGASATDIYYNWNADIDGTTGNDDPWDFGGADGYPLLKFGGHAPPRQGRGSYDKDEDGYIEVSNLAQLNAIRFDLNADGDPKGGALLFPTADSVSGDGNAATAYNAAFPGRATEAAFRMGCPGGRCVGYELTTNLDFDENGDGQITSADNTYWDGGKGWLSIKAFGSAADKRYTGHFKGNGYVINNLFIERDDSSLNDRDNRVGLFGETNNSRIESLGVTNANIKAQQWVGGIVGRMHGGAIVACFTTGTIEGVNPGGAGNNGTVGGIVGRMDGGTLSSSYSHAAIRGQSAAGGIVGWLAGGSITNSYSTGSVTRTAGFGSAFGGVAGWMPGGSFTNTYWNTQTSGRSNARSGSGGTLTNTVGKTTAELQTPTGYTGIYSTWNADIDSVAGNDDPWDFGASSQYPILKYGGHTGPIQGRGGDYDYDMDNDGYIEVSTLAQLDAMRLDLDGNGAITVVNLIAYNAAFPNRMLDMGCPNTGCTGYELIASLDFDTNGDGSVSTAGDTYWNGGGGWIPIGNATDQYATNFKGNGNTINNLFIKRAGAAGAEMGLFNPGTNARIETLGVTNANVRGHNNVGILAGYLRGSAEIVACYTTGKVHTAHPNNGGGGGLVGAADHNSTINSSYSTAYVSGLATIGGIVGRAHGSASITNSYSTGRVYRTSGSNPSISGLVGWVSDNTNSVTDSYWDVTSSGITQSHNAPGTSTATVEITAKTPRELQTVTGYTGIFADWNVDLDGDTNADDPWDFGNGMQYPMLKYDGMSTDPQGGQAMGIPDSYNAPVVGERLGVCLTPDDFPNRGIVPGQTYHEAWVWEKSTNGDTWTVIPGAGDGDNPPTYEYSPTADDVGSYIRAKVKLTDGSFAHTRALGARVVATSGAADGGEFPFVSGHAAPRVGSLIKASYPLPDGATGSRVGWQRCENNTAPFNCTAVLDSTGTWWTRYIPTSADVGFYLRVYAYYETADGDWTRSVTPFTTGVVAR